MFGTIMSVGAAGRGRRGHRAARAGWRALRGTAKGTNALKEHLAEHRRDAKR
jgi:hypothetical protein